MLRTAATRLAAVPGCPTVSWSLSISRGMAGEGLKGFSDAEKVIENLHFSKEDERLLAKLLSKVKSQANAADKNAAMTTRAAELADINPIVKKYDISSTDVEKLFKWKHTQF